ncbi:hypothetical protein DACRYDRAFT_112692 [Dacryopinax primogenitus]|uniref:Uncharacterized protein n=1 Tax=Dacryopinax primogenitus (strain DJM 731) TaxID=1858805 RepID=M5FYA7_DACPD|nr:uncharacterized protein DACRYDRAFT_112692 [Dacryopinax primogenitus]EJT96512.1 hypothetical protein DACRYDRAFT_112692 [Dacryopinax primogenitus]
MCLQILTDDAVDTASSTLTAPSSSGGLLERRSRSARHDTQRPPRTAYRKYFTTEASTNPLTTHDPCRPLSHHPRKGGCNAIVRWKKDRNCLNLRSAQWPNTIRELSFGTYVPLLLQSSPASYACLFKVTAAFCTESHSHELYQCIHIRTPSILSRTPSIPGPT